MLEREVVGNVLGTRPESRGQAQWEQFIMDGCESRWGQNDGGQSPSPPPRSSRWCPR